MFERWGLGDVLHGFPGDDFLEVRVDGQPRLLAEGLPGLETTSKSVPQQALVRGLIAALLADGADLRFEAADVALHRLAGRRPLVTYTGQDGQAHEIECDFVAGCDGDRGVSAASVPADAITATEVFPLRNSIREPMSYGRLYLLGDAAHIIPPMGAKGMNFALFDAEAFAAAVRDFTAAGDDAGLRGYSDTCLARTWRYQEFSNWLADMMHGASGAPVGGGGHFRERIMRARLERLLSSESAARYYAEMFTGLG